MTQEQLIGLLIVLWGAYALWAGLIGWRRALRGRLIRSLVRLIGPVGTRIVFVIGGLALVVGGILFMGAGPV